MNWSTPSTSQTTTYGAAPSAQARTISINTDSDFLTSGSASSSTQPFMHSHMMHTSNSQENLQQRLAATAQGGKLTESEAAEQRFMATEIARLIKRSNLKLIAFDFDQTIVSVHTGGFWRDSAEKLAEFVRPAFQYLIPELLKNESLFIAIVTFSPQVELIKEVLKISMKAAGNSISRIAIKGNTKEFVDNFGIEHCFYNGKEIHIRLCKEYFEMITPKCSKISNESILLIDDDVDNIAMAANNSHLAFQVNATFRLTELFQYLKQYF